MAKKINAKKILIQKSGYFGRSAKPNKKDLELICKLSDYAVKTAASRKSGVIGFDEENNNKLSCIDFKRIKGGKPFNKSLKWYKNMMTEIKAI